MYELIQVANNTYYVNCPAKIGVYRCNDTEIYLIDSGNDKDAGRKVRRVLEAEGIAKFMSSVLHRGSGSLQEP